MARDPAFRRSVPGLFRVLRQFWPWIRAERVLIGTSALALLAGVALRLLEPWPLKFILDRVIPTSRPDGLHTLPVIENLEPMQLLTAAALALVLMSVLRAGCEYSHKVGFAKIGNRVLRRVRNQVYIHVQALSLSFHTKARSGDLIVRVTRDVSLLRDVMATALLPLLASFLVLLGMGTIMFLLEWQLALVALATVPLIWWATLRTSKGIHAAASKQRKREGAMAATAAESFNAIHVVQALSLQEVFAEDFASRNEQSQKEDMKAARLSAGLGRKVDVLLALCTAVVLWFAGRSILTGLMTPGDLVVFLTYLRRAFKPVKDMAKYAARLAKATAAGERVLALLERTPEVRDLPGARPAPALAGTVRFDSVSFGYEDQQRVLDHLAFEVVPGQCLALIGASGIGKSTVANLLLRLYDPDGGRVLVDGTDIREFTIQSLRSQISVVLQDTLLFSGTVAENIALGAPKTSPADLEAAARLAQAHEFIQRMPEGYDTPIGERGATLSHGQRQRIAIARAAFRRTPILILDEPTTGLDQENAEKVAAALFDLAKDRTTLLITHDLDLAAHADRILVLSHGRQEEWGSPRELAAAGGTYAQLRRDWTTGRLAHGT